MILPLWAQLGGMVGTTLVVVRGQLLARLRAAAAPLGCAQCVGWWVGLLVGAVDAIARGAAHPSAALGAWLGTGLCIVMTAGLSSGLSMAADHAAEWLQVRSDEAWSRARTPTAPAADGVTNDGAALAGALEPAKEKTHAG